MSIRATAWAWTVQTSPTAKLVLLALADHADEVGHCWPSVARVVEMTGLSERAVRTAIGTMTTSGLIQTRRGDGRGHSSRYRLNINAAPERVQEMHPYAENEGAIKGAPRAERVHVVPERVQQVPERVQEMHPEPSRTVSEPPKNHQTRAGRARAEVPAVDLPDWLPADAWADWCTHRRGRTWTQRAAELSIAKLDEMRQAGSDPRAVINQSIVSGWRGLFPVKQMQRQDKPGKLDWLIEDMTGART